jgi:cytidylate kinase, putative
MRITISGPPGSGKTTVCSLLSERLQIGSIVFGRMFRELAKEKGISLSELGTLAENDPSIDISIDDHILEIAKGKEDVILESRLSAYMLYRNGIPALKVYLDATPETRIERISARDGESPEDAYKNTMERHASEAKRYMKYYGINADDKSVYDIVIDTDSRTPDEIVDIIIKEMKKC